MNILITNDDGIYAPGIAKLAEVAKQFGNVYVVAPAEQCSAMSHKISILKEIRVTRAHDFPIEDVLAFRIGGTPADCVKIAVEHLFDRKPDIVFSGINNGYNAGIDIAYSGTVAAAMEAVMKGIPAIAFSTCINDDYQLIDKMLPGVIKTLLNQPPGTGKIWNVNFPEGEPDECKGILWDRTLSKTELYPDLYRVVDEDAEGKTVILQGVRKTGFEESTDLYALLNGYISVGTITNMIIGQ